MLKLRENESQIDLQSRLSNAWIKILDLTEKTGFPPSTDMDVVFPMKKVFPIEALNAAETTLLHMHLGGKVGGTWMFVLNLLSLFH